MKRLEISVVFAIVFSILLSACALNTECDEIRDSVLRLHVLANSDSEADQALKRRVRDRLLAVSGDIFSCARSKEEAVNAAQDNLERMRQEAESEIAACGYDYPVSVSLESSYFNTRTYGDITLPAGRYQALRVVIGKGKGHNWWCVMFPPLCVSPASANEAELSDVLTPEQMALVESDGYEIRFKCVELYEDLKRYLSGESQ